MATGQIVSDLGRDYLREGTFLRWIIELIARSLKAAGRAMGANLSDDTESTDAKEEPPKIEDHVNKQWVQKVDQLPVLQRMRRNQENSRRS